MNVICLHSSFNSNRAFLPGYYRVNYDKENWRRIAAYLNSQNYSNIHVLNRAQLLSDALQLSRHKVLDIEIFIDLVSYLHRETDIVAWIPSLGIFDMLPRKAHLTFRHPIIQVGIARIQNYYINL